MKTLFSQRLRIGDIEWVVGGKWESFIYPKAPSHSSLRRHAVELGASHYVVTEKSVGFFNFHEKVKQKTVHPLIISTAREKKEKNKFYGEYFFTVQSEENDSSGQTKYWIFSIDEKGYPLSQGDQIVQEESLEHIREILEVTDIDSSSIEELCDDITPLSYKLYSVSQIDSIRNIFIIFFIILICIISYIYISKIYNDKKASEELRIKLENDKKNIAKRLAPNRPYPNTWVKTCISNVPDIPFYHGWTLSSWSCTLNNLVIIWHRQPGAIVSDAPNGLIKNDGDTIETTQKLKFPNELGVQDYADKNSEKALYSLLEGLGVVIHTDTSTIMGRNGIADGMKSINISIPVDPRKINFNIKGVILSSMSHSTGIPNNFMSENTYNDQKLEIKLYFVGKMQ